MSINRYIPHLLILPEDDANRQIANGFLIHSNIVNTRSYVLPVAGGWNKVCETFEKNHIDEMRRLEARHILLLIDFDNNENRFNEIKKLVPDDLSSRVFILGCLSEPEALRKTMGSFENIGLELAKDCYLGVDDNWNHDLIKHNHSEMLRLGVKVKSWIFKNS